MRRGISEYSLDVELYDNGSGFYFHLIIVIVRSTFAKAGFNNRAITYPRGKLLGGSSSISKTTFFRFSRLLITLLIDFMFYTRGSAQEFDRFAKLTGDSGWSWNSLQPYLKKVRHDYPQFWTYFEMLKWA